MTTPFRDRVLEVVASIPRGRVLAYGDVATLCGSPRAARAVGSTLRACGGAVPWHRVVNGAGRISFKGDLERAALQRQCLRDEGIAVDDDWVLGDWAEVRWQASFFPAFFQETYAFDRPPTDWTDE